MLRKTLTREKKQSIKGVHCMSHVISPFFGKEGDQIPIPIRELCK